MTTEERENRLLTRWLTALAILLALIAGLVIGSTFPDQVNPHAAPEPDWTVASCEEWADTSTPVLPPYTRTDVCAVQTESGAWYISSPTNPSPALTAPVTH